MQIMRGKLHLIPRISQSIELIWFSVFTDQFHSDLIPIDVQPSRTVSRQLKQRLTVVALDLKLDIYIWSTGWSFNVFQYFVISSQRQPLQISLNKRSETGKMLVIPFVKYMLAKYIFYFGTVCWENVLHPYVAVLLATCGRYLSFHCFARHYYRRVFLRWRQVCSSTYVCFFHLA